MGADLPQSLVETIDRFIVTMHPKHMQARQEGKLADTLSPLDRNARVLKGSQR